MLKRLLRALRIKFSPKNTSYYWNKEQVRNPFLDAIARGDIVPTTYVQETTIPAGRINVGRMMIPANPLEFNRKKH